MWRSYFTDKKWSTLVYGVDLAFLILSLLAQTYIDVKFNEWYGGFYDLLQKLLKLENYLNFTMVSFIYEFSYPICNYLFHLQIILQDCGLLDGEKL